MKSILKFSALAMIGFMLVLTSCSKQDTSFLDVPLENGKTTEIGLTNFEPEVVVKGTGNDKDYQKVVVEELVKAADCKYEVVSGIVEFYYENEMVFGVNFGNNACDELATITWLKEGVLETKEVNVWKVFKDAKDEGIKDETGCDDCDKDDFEEDCFELVLPISFTMPDGSTLTVSTDADWDTLKGWYEINASEQEPTINYPIEITLENGTSQTINNDEVWNRIIRKLSEATWTNDKKDYSAHLHF